MSTAIAVHNLSKLFRVPMDRSTTLKYRVTHLRGTSRYRELWALRDISFDIKQGEFCGVIGGNGSGKSTLLKILAGIYRAASGQILVDGEVAQFLELGVGFNPELTARENVFLNGAILGLSRRELSSRMHDIFQFAELTDFVDQKLKNFSSGMSVRLAFTVAIQGDADILLMDEVLAVGDARFQAKCFDVFAGYRKQGKTVVLVTHDLGAVDTYCDRALLLEDGNLRAVGSARDVTNIYRSSIAAEEQAATH